MEIVPEHDRFLEECAFVLYFCLFVENPTRITHKMLTIHVWQHVSDNNEKKIKFYKPIWCSNELLWKNYNERCDSDKYLPRCAPFLRGGRADWVV
jgi:hypothetical protein